MDNSLVHECNEQFHHFRFCSVLILVVMDNSLVLTVSRTLSPDHVKS